MALLSWEVAVAAVRILSECRQTALAQPTMKLSTNVPSIKCLLGKAPACSAWQGPSAVRHTAPCHSGLIKRELLANSCSLSTLGHKAL